MTDTVKRASFPMYQVSPYMEWVASPPAYGEKLPRVLVHQREDLTPEGRFVTECLVRWGLIAAIPDGEDSAGRSKLTLTSPTELVERALAVASLAFSWMRENGLLVPVPSMEQICDDVSQMKATNE